MYNLKKAIKKKSNFMRGGGEILNAVFELIIGICRSVV